jgi:MipA family protein
MLPKTTVIFAAVLLQATTLAAAAGVKGDRPFAFSAMLGAGYAPIYEGSNTSEASPLLDFNVSFGDGRFFAGTRGIGYAPVLTETLSLRLGIGYGGGRKMKDDPANLAGLGDIDDEALGLLSAEYRMGQFGFGADVMAGSEYGVTADLKATTTIAVSDKVNLSGEILATYADQSHMQRYFGVTTAQSAASGLDGFAAGSGMKSAGVGITVSYDCTEATSVMVGARYSKLAGDAAESPITRDASQASAFVGLSTRF